MGNSVVAQVLSGQHLGNFRGNKPVFWGNISDRCPRGRECALAVVAAIASITHTLPRPFE